MGGHPGTLPSSHHTENKVCQPRGEHGNPANSRLEMIPNPRIGAHMPARGKALLPSWGALPSTPANIRLIWAEPGPVSALQADLTADPSLTVWQAPFLQEGLWPDAPSRLTRHPHPGEHPRMEDGPAKAQGGKVLGSPEKEVSEVQGEGTCPQRMGQCGRGEEGYPEQKLVAQHTAQPLHTLAFCPQQGQGQTP